MRRIMAHVRRFRLAEVESDVLKILYESLIDRDERHGLGEYYTPDWLAAKIVEGTSSTGPCRTACARSRLRLGHIPFSRGARTSCERPRKADMEPDLRAAEVCAHVAGMDIHPVAVIIARVTYLLGARARCSQPTQGRAVDPGLSRRCACNCRSVELIGRQGTRRFACRRRQRAKGKSGEKDENGREQLDFPDTFCRDPALFDKAIERMRTGSEVGRDARAD